MNFEERLDKILSCIERRMAVENIVNETGELKEEVERISAMVSATIHKRRLGLIPKIGLRTVGIDWREI